MDTEERERRLNAAAATGNVEHYTAVVRMMMEEEGICMHEHVVCRQGNEALYLQCTDCGESL